MDEGCTYTSISLRLVIRCVMLMLTSGVVMTMSSVGVAVTMSSVVEDHSQTVQI